MSVAPEAALGYHIREASSELGLDDTDHPRLAKVLTVGLLTMEPVALKTLAAFRGYIGGVLTEGGLSANIDKLYGKVKPKLAPQPAADSADEEAIKLILTRAVQTLPKDTPDSSAERGTHLARAYTDYGALGVVVPPSHRLLFVGKARQHLSKHGYLETLPLLEKTSLAGNNSSERSLAAEGGISFKVETESYLEAVSITEATTLADIYLDGVSAVMSLQVPEGKFSSTKAGTMLAPGKTKPVRVYLTPEKAKALKLAIIGKQHPTGASVCAVFNAVMSRFVDLIGPSYNLHGDDAVERLLTQEQSLFMPRLRSADQEPDAEKLPDGGFDKSSICADHLTERGCEKFKRGEPCPMWHPTSIRKKLFGGGGGGGGGGRGRCGGGGGGSGGSWGWGGPSSYEPSYDWSYGNDWSYGGGGRGKGGKGRNGGGKGKGRGKGWGWGRPY